MLVDDDWASRRLVAEMLTNAGYNVVEAESGEEALEKAPLCSPDLLLLDMMLPGIDGVEVCRRVRENPLLREIPLFVVTSLEDRESRLAAFNAGADDFISKPVDKAELRVRVGNTVKLNRYRNLLAERERNIALLGDLQHSAFELALAYDATLEGWVRALDLRDNETEGHTQRVTDLTMKLAETLGVPAEQRVHVYRGALLHDIGKIGIPDSILRKTGPLTDEERRTMEKHPTFAYEMLSHIDYLRPALDIPYCHHEHWDGSGYPRSLRGDEIPLPARVFTVADVWDALLYDRRYREGWQPSRVREYMRQQKGRLFDPDIVDSFLDLTM